MKLMALVMIAKIGSNVLLGLAQAPTASSDKFVTTLAIAGISVVVFIIAMYVPNIIQGETGVRLPTLHDFQAGRGDLCRDSNALALKQSSEIMKTSLW